MRCLVNKSKLIICPDLSLRLDMETVAIGGTSHTAGAHTALIQVQVLAQCNSLTGVEEQNTA
jgi:hypothetical protein